MCQAGSPCCPTDIGETAQARSGHNLKAIALGHIASYGRVLMPIFLWVQELYELGESFLRSASLRSLCYVLGLHTCVLGCVPHAWLVWFVIVWSSSPRPSAREPSNPVSPWGLGLGLHVGGGGHLGTCEEPQDRKGSLVWA